MRLLLDTNVMLDIFAARKEFYHEALALKIMGLSQDAELWVSAKSFTDVFYLMKNRGKYESDSIQDIFLENLEYLHVCKVEQEDIVESAKMKWPDFEDCLVARCAEKVKADVLITRDRKGFEQASVKSCSPVTFFEMLEREHGIVYDEIAW
ncbi:PIN domain-containing protein [Gordonibacter massiliensis (ex Traore et al. 2017)]|uniref:PIN domain-containing protein n=1 Tax=Gordonibacter massiliensis (ex Traore et al. 2017) TaxID=1841863 RepID=UPI001C8B5E5D|nr:PIN domain-containing protein [Gordonibacter massiliensis (ex Traore et al. 2017)]MBX9034118.1 PIN domain-containing protein [Gordonibacter massiliensis (ex Traore et al. 2017)]